MKVTLINPLSPFLEDERVFPYLGIVSIATSLRDNKHDVDVVDLSGKKDWEREVKKLPTTDVYGVTSTSAQFKHVYKIGQMLKGKGLTIIGGTHANSWNGLDEVNRNDLGIWTKKELLLKKHFSFP